MFQGLTRPLHHGCLPCAERINAPRQSELFLHQPIQHSFHAFSDHIVAMKLTSAIISLVALFSVASAVDVRYDPQYDNSEISLSAVTCSNGANGLLTKKYTTFGSLPSFPNIGAAKAVGGWNSPECGSCWQISYEGKSVNVIVVDHTGDGFNLSLEAVNALTDGHAEDFGVVHAQAKQVDKSLCGL